MKWTMKDFTDGKVAVVYKNRTEAKEFLDLCDKFGLLWNSSSKATNFMPPYDNGYIGCDRRTHALMCGDDFLYAMSDNYELVSMSDYVEAKGKHPAKYHVSLVCVDGKTTNASLFVNGKVVKTATAKCNPADTFSFAIGAKTALERLFEKQQKAMEFRVGDRVLIRKDLKGGKVYGSVWFSPRMEKYCGKIITVESVNGGCLSVDGWTFSPEMVEKVVR